MKIFVFTQSVGHPKWIRRFVQFQLINLNEKSDDNNNWRLHIVNNIMRQLQKYIK